jgi:hypothetical protein
MIKYIDVVSEKLFENNNINEIENVFRSLSISRVYVVQEINQKEGFKKKIDLPASKEINYEKVFLINDLNINVSKISEKLIGNGGNINNISKVLLSKKYNYLYNPFSEKLSFDEGSVTLAKENNKKLIIDINDYRQEKSISSKIVKQTPYILERCLKKEVDFIFCSYAKRIDEIVDPIVKINFLKLFNIPETLTKRLLSEDL